jgi:hypothetical protein
LTSTAAKKCTPTWNLLHDLRCSSVKAAKSPPGHGQDKGLPPYLSGSSDSIKINFQLEHHDYQNKTITRKAALQHMLRRV